jgi:hypothetical protein
MRSGFDQKPSAGMVFGDSSASSAVLFAAAQDFFHRR